MLFSELVPPDAVPGWAGALSTLGATGVLGWYAWYTNTKTIPSQQAQFSQEMAASRAACAEEKKELVQSFREELKDERTNRMESAKELSTAIRELSTSIRGQQK